MICYTNKHHIAFEIDDEDYLLVSSRAWWYQRNGYIVTEISQRTVLLHRLLMNTPEGFETDHINGNKLDNRKSNLRICTRSQNQHNQKPRTGSSKYKGVCWYKPVEKWLAQIRSSGKKKHIGLFSDEKEAALAYNSVARELFGEYARLNIVED